MSHIFRSFEANNGLFNENERGIWPKWIFRTSAWMHVGRAMQEQLPSRFFYSRTASYWDRVFKTYVAEPEKIQTTLDIGLPKY